MKLPGVNLLKVTKAFLKAVFAHKILLIFALVMIAGISGSLVLRKNLVHSLAVVKQVKPFNDVISLNPSSPSPIPSPEETAHPVLGVSTDTTSGSSTDISNNAVPTTPPLPDPTPIPSYSPIPTSTVSYSTSSSPSSSCSGTPNADNSQVYINSGSGFVTISAGSSATIVVDLQDCGNNKVSGDHLTITLTSGDSATTINGNSIGSGFKAQAQNGVYTFQVSSPNATTAVFAVQDTDHNFAVTMPGYKNPQVSFTSGSSTSSTGGSTSSNPNCTTGSGVPNFWYSIFTPSSTISTSTSTTITVTIKDCAKNTVGSDAIAISMNSGDSGVQISPASFTTSSGTAAFTVSSQVATTATFTIKDVTNKFNVTDAYNQQLKITFTGNGSSASPTPSSTASPTSSPTPTPTASGNTGVGTS